jgi:hypothetical protein
MEAIDQVKKERSERIKFVVLVLAFVTVAVLSERLNAAENKTRLITLESAEGSKERAISL